jgi:hypothetical protein
MINIPIVDMVFTWVDGTDDKIIQQRNMYKKENNIIYNPRTRYEQLNEIILSIKSVLKFIKWINKIYIVTNNQIPPIDKYLIESGKVIIIDQNDIIPKKYLPTFNSDVIESFLHNIEGLSEIFLYNNDDMMHFNYVKRNDVYKIKNNEIIFKIRSGNNDIKIIAPSNILYKLYLLYKKIVPPNEYNQRLDYTRKLLYNHYHYDDNTVLVNNHHTKFLRKSTMKYIEDEFPEELDKMRKHRFRSVNYIQYLFLFINVDNKLHKNIIIKKSNNSHVYTTHINKKNLIINNLIINNLNNYHFTIILKKRPKFACLNSMDYSCKHKFEEFMNKLDM